MDRIRMTSRKTPWMTRLLSTLAAGGDTGVRAAGKGPVAGVPASGLVTEGASGNGRRWSGAGRALSRRRVLSWLGLGMAGTAALALGGCDLFEDRVRYRLKLILAVETPSGLRRGESVVEFFYSMVPKSMRKFYLKDACCSRFRITKGEAVVVDLGEGRFLFALLDGFHGIKAGIERAGVPFSKPSEIREALHRMRKGELQRRFRLTPDDLPLLVTFEDVQRPETVKRVDPWDLDAAFGCDRDTGPKPWRKEGVPVWLWHRRQMALRAAKEVTQEMGLPAAAAEPLLVVQSRPKGLWDAGVLAAARKLEAEWPLRKERARLKTLGVDRGTQRIWKKRFKARYEALTAQPPRDTSRDCYRLKAAWVEVTDEPVTTGKVEKVLGWLCKYKMENRRLSGDSSIGISSAELSDNLGVGAFSIGGCHD